MVYCNTLAKYGSVVLHKDTLGYSFSRLTLIMVDFSPAHISHSYQNNLGYYHSFS